MRSIRVKQVLRVAARIDGRVGVKQLRIGKEIMGIESGEEYAEKVIKFLREGRESMCRKEAEEDDVT